MSQVERRYAAVVAAHYRRTHERVLKLVEDLSDEQLAWRLPSHPHSLGFNLWHLARWADQLQMMIPRMTHDLGHRLGQRSQLWETEGLATRWGLTGAELGYEGTGMLLDDTLAATLPLPAKAELVEYARRAFDVAEEAVAAVDDEQWLQVEQTNPQGVVGSAILTHLTHENRHLGEMEFLRGLLGLTGSATG